MLMNSVAAVSAEFFSLLLFNDFWLGLKVMARKGNIIGPTNIYDLHFFLVVHVVDSQAALVDEEIETGIHGNQQLLCLQ